MAKVWETWWMFVICLYAMHVYIHLIFTLLSVHQSNRHKVCFENGWCFQSKRRKKWHFCLQRGNSIRKSWKLNSSYRSGWRAVFFFLLFRSHCIWLKMVTKCDVFDVSTRHSLKKYLVSDLESAFCQWSEYFDRLQRKHHYFHRNTLWLGAFHCWELYSYSVQFSHNQ